jgi:hypothetical protein
MITQGNLWAQLKDRGNANIFDVQDSGAPTDGTSGTGVNVLGPGSTYVDSVTGVKYRNVGTLASPVFSQELQTIRVNITNAQIKAMRATPVTLVAAPGASKWIEFVGGYFLLKAGANVLTESTANIGIKYKDGSSTQISETVEMTGFIDQATNQITTIRTKLDGIVATAVYANQPLVAHNLGAGEFAGNAAADALLVAFISYRVWPTT